jgi:hypothetical protein
MDVRALVRESRRHGDSHDTAGRGAAMASTTSAAPTPCTVILRLWFGLILLSRLSSPLLLNKDRAGYGRKMYVLCRAVSFAIDIVRPINSDITVHVTQPLQ